MAVIGDTDNIDTHNIDTNNNDNNINNNINKKKSNKRKKIKEEAIIIPTYGSFNGFLTKKYSSLQLKNICKHYKLNVTGNKQVLSNSIYKYLYLSYHASILQRFWRKHYTKRYAKLHGPARFKRDLCVNDTDFFTMDNMKDIPFAQFFSYKDTDNMIYGFDIMSLYNLIYKSDNYDTFGNNGKNEILNPYTRNPISASVKRNFKSLLFLSNLLKEDVQLAINETTSDENKVIVNNTLEFRTITLFNDIDHLGNYTNPLWFLELQRTEYLVYIRELYDIWTYRAQLSEQVKYEICPNGNPFSLVQMNELPGLPLRELQFAILLVMETMVKTGNEQHSRYLGSTYVLCALTLVNTHAAQALPWLYESVAMHY
jgi:hypothetical protein